MPLMIGIIVFLFGTLMHFWAPHQAEMYDNTRLNVLMGPRWMHEARWGHINATIIQIAGATVILLSFLP